MLFFFFFTLLLFASSFYFQPFPHKLSSLGYWRIVMHWLLFSVCSPCSWWVEVLRAHWFFIATFLLSSNHWKNSSFIYYSGLYDWIYYYYYYYDYYFGLFYFIFLKRQNKVKSMKKIDCNQDSYKTQEKRIHRYKALYYMPTTLDLWMLKFIRRSAFCLANVSSMPLVDLLICWNVSWHKQDIPDLLEKEMQFPWAFFGLLPVGKGNIRQITLYN